MEEIVVAEGSREFVLERVEVVVVVPGLAWPTLQRWKYEEWRRPSLHWLAQYPPPHETPRQSELPQERPSHTAASIRHPRRRQPHCWGRAPTQPGISRPTRRCSREPHRSVCLGYRGRMGHRHWKVAAILAISAISDYQQPMIRTVLLSHLVMELRP